MYSATAAVAAARLELSPRTRWTPYRNRALLLELVLRARLKLTPQARQSIPQRLWLLRCDAPVFGAALCTLLELAPFNHDLHWRTVRRHWRKCCVHGWSRRHRLSEYCRNPTLALTLRTRLEVTP